MDINSVVCNIYKLVPLHKYVRTYVCPYVVCIYVHVCVRVRVFLVWCVLTQRYTRRSLGNTDHMIRTSIGSIIDKAYYMFYEYARPHMYTHTSLYTCVCMFVCLACVRACVYVCMYVSTYYIHNYPHIRIHTRIP